MARSGMRSLDHAQSQHFVVAKSSPGQRISRDRQQRSNEGVELPEKAPASPGGIAWSNARHTISQQSVWPTENPAIAQR
jgi:hypothetical protein